MTPTKDNQSVMKDAKFALEILERELRKRGRDGKADEIQAIHNGVWPADYLERTFEAIGREERALRELLDVSRLLLRNARARAAA